MSIRNDIADLVCDNMGTLILVMIGFAILLGFMVASETGRAREAFMSECLQDRKQYECTAMWRSGDRGGGTYIAPAVIPRSR